MKAIDTQRREPAASAAAAAESAERRLPAAADVLAGLVETTQELNTATDLEAGLQAVADRLRRYVPYDTLGVLLIDDLGRELRFALAVGFRAEVAEHWRFGMGQGVVGTVAQTGEPILAADVRDEPRYIGAEESVRSELAVPLVVKGRTIGVLDLGSRQPGFFASEHLTLLEPLSGHLAAAIDGARLYQNLHEQARTLSLLHEVSRELASILDREQLLERVAERLKRVVDYDVFGVLLWNEESQLLEPSLAVYRDGPRSRSARPMALGEGICGTAAALRQSLRVPNVHVDPRYVSCVEDLEVRSELAVPMTFKERLIGVLDLESAEYDAFTARHEQALATLASSLAIALENARLYERLQEDERRLADDLSTAREIQKRLLPKASPWLPGLQIAVGYEPARHLGGDFYDFLRYGEGRIAVAVGDVAGKATSAALYGSLAIGILREHADQHRPEPARMLADMNDRLHRVGIDNRFLAMAFGVYDSTSRVLTLANSGLPHPLLLRGWRVHPIPAEGVPLGLLADRSYEEMRLELRHGDAVVISTDGIEESLDQRQEEFGRERVAQTLTRAAGGSAQSLADALLDATREFGDGSEPADDRTVMVLRF